MTEPKAGLKSPRARIKRVISRRYRKDGAVSPFQAFLKASLVPLDMFDQRLPGEGVILDLGCGEGVLANLTAAVRPNCKVIGIDRDSERLEIARRNAEANAEFLDGDIFDLAAIQGVPETVDAIILNDVVHHQPHGRQYALLADALKRLRPGGLMVLKEVDIEDKMDEGMTRFFDSRLYPDDPLCFRSRPDWLDLLARLGIDGVEVERVRHPWPASRTVFFAPRPGTLTDTRDSAGAIGAVNLAANEKTTVFVTGATGFLGRHLCTRLMDDGLDGKPVRLLYLCRNPGRQPEWLSGAVPVFGDLDDLPMLAPALKGVDYVFHLAAEVKFPKGVDVWRNNHQGTVALLEALQGVGLKRFVHTSTIGAVDRMPSDDCSRPLNETDPPNPLSDYGLSKLEAERAVQASGIPHAILRIPWGYGPGMTPDTHVRFLTTGVAENGLFTKVCFPGKVSIIASRDLVDNFIMLAEKPEAESGLFFTTDNLPLSLGNLFRRYASVIGKPHRMLPVPGFASAIARALRRFMPLTLQNLNSDVLTADPSRIRELGFRPTISQREGLSLLARAHGHLKAVDGDEAFLDRRPVSLVTGAAAGIGNAVARRLQQDGHGLLLVDRDAEKLREAEVELGVRTLLLDLADADAATRISDYLDQNELRLDWVINNAGIGLRGEVSELNWAQQQKVVQLNAVALAALSHLALRHFIKTGVGTLVNVGSSAAFQPLPFMSVYSASKAFVQNFTLALAGEHLDTPGLRILLVNPSGVDSGFQKTANVKKDPKERLLSMEHVANAIVEQGYTGSPIITIGARGKMMALLSRVIPSRFQPRLWANLISKLR